MGAFQKGFVFVISLLATTVIVVNNLNQLLNDILSPDSKLRTSVGLFVAVAVLIIYAYINRDFLGFKKVK